VKDSDGASFLIPSLFRISGVYGIKTLSLVL
jgi:hypothetical protein